MRPHPPESPSDPHWREPQPAGTAHPSGSSSPRSRTGIVRPGDQTAAPVQPPKAPAAKVVAALLRVEDHPYMGSENSAAGKHPCGADSAGHRRSRMPGEHSNAEPRDRPRQNQPPPSSPYNSPPQP